MKPFYDALAVMILIVLLLCLIFYSQVHAAEQPTLYVFSGQAVSNSVTDEHSPAWNIEQETPTVHGVWNFGYLNEGHQLHDKRDGIYALYKFPYQFAPRVETAFAIGPYFTATTVTDRDGINYQDHYSWAALAAASVKYKLDKHWSLQGKWDHVLYATRNKDADIFLVGIGYTPVTW